MNVTFEVKLPENLVSLKKRDGWIQSRNWNEFAIAQEAIEDFGKIISDLHRQIENQYRDLPWPQSIRKIVVFTKIQDGQGDMAGAAKAIAAMQRMCPHLTIDWVLKDFLKDANIEKARSFLNCNDLSKISIRDYKFHPSDNEQAQFLITGPVKLSDNKESIQETIKKDIHGPLLAFVENGFSMPFSEEMDRIVDEIRAGSQLSKEEVYKAVHPILFRSQSTADYGLLPMGLTPRSGVFLDESRTKAPLSRIYCCPSYLKQIEDKKLLKDILEAMNAFEDGLEPDYDTFSFNFGYAHHLASLAKFIDCVAIHEKK